MSASRQPTEIDGAAGESTNAFLTGTQALLEAILLQRNAEQHLSTAGFISGYRGSPLGGFDELLWKSEKRLVEAKVQFKPGLNEDLAATYCWGTQQLSFVPDPTVEGVTAFWYGKGPGVDRSGDALKHANYAGTSPKGGVVLLVGDDHGSKSSTVPHQSEQLLAGAGIPVLYPASVQEYVDYLGLAVELSRFAGVWVAFKCVTEVIESATDVRMPHSPSRLVYPEVARPPQGFHISPTYAPLEVERTLYQFRLPAAKQFAIANELDCVTFESPHRTLGLIAPGKSYVDLVEALRLLGIDREIAKQIGLRIYKPLMIWPLVEETATDFCRGHREVMVVEEKRSFVEQQLAECLLRLRLDERPTLSGKRSASGEELLPEFGELSPLSVAQALAQRLLFLGMGDQRLRSRWQAMNKPATLVQMPRSIPTPRMPAFCSGCPHSRSTKLPEGSLAFGGIGCHGMAIWVPGSKTLSPTHMGAEGANWIGLQDFVGTKHVYQQMGDGTYAHSGLLAIRAAVAAGSNITYKILDNGAAAMTGGQPVEGGFTAVDIARQLLAERVKKVVLVTENEWRLKERTLPFEVYARTELETVQRRLREIAGVTAVIYEQGCAAERRRLRKAGKYPDPAIRTFINSDVCEGCGDCGQKANCVSIVPIETEVGRKRSIDQESCNKDYTCVEGFCPSFVFVRGGKKKSDETSQALLESIGTALREPVVRPPSQVFNVLLAGIGGSGVITLGGLVAKAARHCGYRVSTFDITGLAQKNGPVYSHVRLFSREETEKFQPRIPTRQLDLLVGCDIVAASSPGAMDAVDADRTRVVANAAVVPVAAFQKNPDLMLTSSPYEDVFARVLSESNLVFFRPSDVVRQRFGSGALMNIVTLGYAVQLGNLPISPAALEKVMTSQGKPDLKSILAFRSGRLIAQDSELADTLLARVAPASRVPLAQLEFEALVERGRELLVEYQDTAYANRFEETVRGLARRDVRGELAKIVALNLLKLMRYKDEYEVARLHSAKEFLERLRQEFEGDFVVTYSLAPPFIPSRKTENGEPRKIAFGAWMRLVFRCLAKFKRIRGTWMDPFGYQADRRVERALVNDYIVWVKEVEGRLDGLDYSKLLKIASLPEKVSGYGPVKERSIVKMQQEREALWNGMNRAGV